MFLNKKATSIVEALIVLFIVVTGVIGMYQVFNNSQKLSSSTSNKLQAIQISREGVEAVKNIRDTNWILFSSDTSNCWNVYNYNPTCVGSNLTLNDISAGSYIISQNSNNRWYLFPKVAHIDSYKSSGYRNNFKVGLDSNGFFTQTGSMSEIKPLFTREIIISYPDTGSSNDSRLNITSLVQWVDPSSSESRKVEFTAVLTNWKK